MHGPTFESATLLVRLGPNLSLCDEDPIFTEVELHTLFVCKFAAYVVS